jgi:signal transduction histidine kinase/ActR/RegA family two-component response regulator
MGALMRTHDWAASSLGEPSTWPQALRSAVRLLLNSGHPMYIWWGPTGACLYNDAYRPSIGPEHHPHSLGRPVREVWKEIWSVIGPQIERVMSGGGATWNKDQLVPITRNGVYEDVYWTYSFSAIDEPIAPHGVGGVLVICAETTERVMAQAAMAAQVKRQERLFQCAPGFIAILRGPKHTFEFANEAYGRLAGERDFLGKPLLDIIPEMREQEFPRLLDDAYANGRRVVAHGRPIQLRRGASNDLEERFVDFIYQPIVEADGFVSGIFIEGFDVTERHEAESALRELNATLEARVEQRSRELTVAQDELRQAQKMEAIGQLTGGIAHDFNNLLAGIMGSLELLSVRMTQGRTVEAERYITAATGAAKRAAALTHRLLAFARHQPLEPKATDVNRLIKDLEELVRRTVGPTIRVRTVTSNDLWSTLVDPNQLENVLLNLCINARDAMPDGGSLLIETTNRVIDDPGGSERAIPAGDYVTVGVTDTGTGMSPEVIARAFDPFFTTKPIGMGTGLGLSMTYGFARQSGGHVRIYSELEKGTTVCLYLPQHLGPIDEADVLERSIDIEPGERAEIILIVEDEPTVRMLIADVIEELGYTSIEASDSTAGLAILQSDVRVDLLITDVGLPGGINGRQMVEAARHPRPDLKVLLVTGYAENLASAHGNLDPGMSLLAKPFSIDALKNKIHELMTTS